MTLDKLTAHVKDGRIVVDQPTDLPEGTELHVVVVDADELDDAGRAEMHAFLEKSWASAKAGNVEPAEILLDELRARG